MSGGSEWRGGAIGWMAPHSDPCINPWQNVTCEDGLITEIALPSRGLVGLLPALDAMSGLRHLDVRDNQLLGEPPVDLVKACNQEMLSCLGIPPHSCSAFGPHARQSMHRRARRPTAPS